MIANVSSMNAAVTLFVLGGARSGKSGFAQAQVEAGVAAHGLEPVFIATAHAYDDEMAARIASHVATRGTAWLTLEAPYDLVPTLDAEASPGRLLLVDCLTLWLSNLMLRGDDVDAAGAELASLARRLPGPAVFVSNEVGAGIVPENALARRFRDAQGRLNQAMAAACANVVLVTAGLPVTLKPAPHLTLSFSS
jgi:adenosylcobinamide kinase/adenosylcobinamide-phosphate guanylyltransferase